MSLSQHRVVVSLLSLCAVGGCRYDVQLHADRDAATTIDALSTDVGSDTPIDDAPDAPPQTCAEGLRLMDVRPSAEHEASIATAGAGDGLRYGILVPPALRDDGASTTRLLIVSRLGAILFSRELALLDGGGAPSETATVHTMPARDGFLVLGARGITRLDVDGASASERTLSIPPLASAQRGAGFVDGDRFVFASSGTGAPLAVFDRAADTVEVTAIETAAAAVWRVHRGGVTIGIDEPTETVEYAASLDGTVTFRSAWPPAPLARRLLGAYTAGGRRLWVTADGEEFRNTVSVHEVPDLGAPIPLTAATLVAPLAVTQEDELLTVAEAPGDLAVVDLARIAIERLGPFTSGSIERGETGYVVLTVEEGALTFRCVP